VTPDGQVHKAPLDGETLADDLDYWQSSVFWHEPAVPIGERDGSDRPRLARNFGGPYARSPPLAQTLANTHGPAALRDPQLIF